MDLEQLIQKLLRLRCKCTREVLYYQSKDISWGRGTGGVDCGAAGHGSCVLPCPPTPLRKESLKVRSSWFCRVGHARPFVAVNPATDPFAADRERNLPHPLPG